MHGTGARTWCTGKAWRERVEREVGGGIGMGNTCRPMAISFQCMTKSTKNKKKKKAETCLLTMVHTVNGSSIVMYGCETWTIKKAEHQRIYPFKLWCWTRLLKVPWIARRSNLSILKESILNIHWKIWCWSWNSNTLAIWCEEPTHWKRPWCWERLKAKGEGGGRGWDG